MRPTTTNPTKTMTLASTIALSLLAITLTPNPVTAGPIYTLATGPAPSFSESGGDFSLTDHVVSSTGQSTTLYLDFRMVNGHPGPNGSIVYQPDNAMYQLYVLDTLLAAPDPQSSHVVLEGIFIGPAVVSDIGSGSGLREFIGDLLVTSTTPNVFDTDAHLKFTFDATHVAAGALVVGGAVPEPASVGMLAVGLVVALVGCRAKWGNHA